LETFKGYFVGFVSLILAGIILSGLTVGCSSAPLPETSYYLLNNQQEIRPSTSITKTSSKSKQTIVLSISELPEYLTQPYLVMQMTDHQLHYAHFHMWADSLQQGLTKALLADLNIQSSVTFFVANNVDIKQVNLATLFINIDYFHASSNSKVMLSGQYWLSTADKNKQVTGKPFYIERQLEQDGYPHSVAKMRELISKLAMQIMEQHEL